MGEKILESDNWEYIDSHARKIAKKYWYSRFLPIPFIGLALGLCGLYYGGLNPTGLVYSIVGFLIGLFIGFLPGYLIGIPLSNAYCGKLRIIYKDKLNKCNMDTDKFRYYVNTMSGALGVNLHGDPSRFIVRGLIKKSYIYTVSRMHGTVYGRYATGTAVSKTEEYDKVVGEFEIDFSKGYPEYRAVMKGKQIHEAIKPFEAVVTTSRAILEEICT
ncbi:MAG: hypothetical protein GXO43_01795 [Crenarchaeota archaeon]|nr:hypothetical protein [Thermoproteota archaeon]